MRDAASHWTWTLGSAAALATGAAAACAHASPPGAAAGGLTLAALGATGLGVALHRQAAEARRAARLSGDPGGRRPLPRSLAALSDRLDAVGHRVDNTHPVTGLPTREHLLQAMAHDLAPGAPPRLLGVVRFADFDRVAAFDDRAANAALSCIGARVVSAVGERHVVSQVDRDAIAVWFRDAPDLDAASAEFAAIAYVAAQEIAGEGEVLTPAVETAAVRWPEDGSSPGHLLLRAAAALGRGEASPLARLPSLQVARDDFALEQDLAQAIAEEQLTMAFQPVVDLSAGRLIGAEALLRWDHPRLGAISPARFIPVVERIGLSERYGLWVLNAACREAKRWQGQGLHGVKVAVNLSARQLVDPELPGKIARTLALHGLDPRALELELTETAAMADAERTRALFAELRATGVSLAIDDFGAGYSSLSYLKNLPFDKLKIDREFVTRVDAKRDSRAICRALLELGRGLDLLVLAEGVETAAEVDALRRLGCSVFQGYFFSKPLGGDDFVRLARDPAWRERLSPAPHRAPSEGSVSA